MEPEVNIVDEEEVTGTNQDDLAAEDTPDETEYE